MVQGQRAEEPRAAYAVSPRALEIARAFDRLSAICQEHVTRQIELLGEVDNSGRRRAVQHDVEIKGHRIVRRKSKKAVR
jgi:hypothetical protein